jgi:hypothetical protein
VKAVVVYESLWGNTAAIARAIAEGIGPGTPAVTTGEATPELLAGADLVVAGAPVLGFRLPTDGMRASVQSDPMAPPADLGHPSMRAWLASLRHGHGRSAAFETRFRWSPGGAVGAIGTSLAEAGYTPGKFIVTGKYGPLRDGETDRARGWGADLARAME